MPSLRGAGAGLALAFVLGLACLPQHALARPDPNQSAGGQPVEGLSAGASQPPAQGVTGSQGCRSCHEKFYQLWSTSFHGLAMRPYSDAFAGQALKPQQGELSIGHARYSAATGPGQGWMTERGNGKKTTYRIAYVIGGKNVFYFLAAMPKGRLQTMPLAYDVHRGEWFDMAGSGLRHVLGAGPNANRNAESRADHSASGRPLDWKAWPYTFNTACRGCHVSQLSAGYDAKRDTYHTTWREPGINCETCHGPGEEHVRVCLAAPKDRPPKDLKLIRGGRDFTPEQNNALCSSCHAKASQLTAGMKPGERFFDHFDLVTYESTDYAPDGRDLGENYTYTSWSRSPCVKSGKLDCLHCHTSSGRYKFADPARANEACLPCHAGRVAEAAQHSRHPAGSSGSRCVSCHMPMTEFARMRRSDHSMLPPTPAATMAYGSPNACNTCHQDKDAAWADAQVRAWRTRDYQAPVLHQTGLIDAARKGDWSRLEELRTYLHNPAGDPVIQASLLRLLRGCPDPGKWDAVLKAAASPSPLVRAAAMESLAASPSRQGAKALLAALSDDYRVVRIRAAASLAALPTGLAKPTKAQASALSRAQGELLASLNVRPDLWSSQYNLGNHYQSQGDDARALDRYNAAIRLNPEGVPPLINASLAYARLGQAAKAETMLQKALELDPDNAPAHFNMGLLMAQRGNATGAERHLRAALKQDPSLAEAALNLGVLLAPTRIQEALPLLQQAARLRPQDPRFAYALAFFMNRAGNPRGAAQVLTELLRAHPKALDAQQLLRHIQAGPR